MNKNIPDVLNVQKATLVAQGKLKNILARKSSLLLSHLGTSTAFHFFQIVNVTCVTVSDTHLC